MLLILSCNPSFIKPTLNLELWSKEVIGNASRTESNSLRQAEINETAPLQNVLLPLRAASLKVIALNNHHNSLRRG